jgi:Subtilase family
MISRDHRGRAAAAGVLILASTLATVVPVSAARAGTGVQAAPQKPTALAVAEALVAAWGPGATVDDSSATHCMSAPAMPLAYRTDRIVLRPPPTMTTPDAVGRVAAALRAEMGQGSFTIGVPETITWDAAADPGSPAPAGTRRASSAAPSSTASSSTASSSAAAEEPLIWRVVAVPIRSLTGEDVPIVRLARRLRQGGLIASPDYLEGPGNGPLGVWPEGGPAPANAPGTPRPGLGGGTTAVVYDTGVPDPSDAIVSPNLTRLTTGDVEEPDRNGDGYADLYYAVHLDAIAGMFATIVPDATVRGVRITGANGVATDFSAAKRMASTLRDAHDNAVWPEVIVASFGSPACMVGAADPGADMVPLGLEMVTEAVDRHQQSVVVAAAGNRGTDKPFYPAAFQTDFPAMISVGALDATTDGDGDPWTSASRSAKAASFSNYGDWVTAWAPGVSLPTYHAVGLRFEINGKEINGYAFVNGTSFAAPLVGAEILEQIARTGQTPQQAWEAIRSSGRTCSQAIGSGVAVALTTMTATATTTADPRLPTQC